MMARKGNQQKNSLDRNASENKFTVSDSVGASLSEKKSKVTHEGNLGDGKELPNSNHECMPSGPSRDRLNKARSSGDRKKNNQRSAKVSTKDKFSDDIAGSVKPMSVSNNLKDGVGNETVSNATESRGDDEVPFGSNPSSRNFSSTGCTSHKLADEDVMDGPASSDAVASMNLKASVLSILKVASGWLQRQKPLFDTLTTTLLSACDYIHLKTEHASPIIWTWLAHFGKLVLLASMVWLDCTIRGLESLLRLGTTSFFTVIWCSILSVIAMTGASKFLVMMATAGLMAFFVGFTLAILVIVVFAAIFLWLYGSFWITGLVIFVGGASFALSLERLALFVTTVYSIHCARFYVGWLGVLFGINLSFISSDLLIHFLKNNMNEHDRSNSHPEQSSEAWGRPGLFQGEPIHASPSDDTFQAGSGRSADCNPGAPSTSGTESELTSEDEVVRLLNCSDHYSALGLSRYGNIDVSSLKKEYRKKLTSSHGFSMRAFLSGASVDPLHQLSAQQLKLVPMGSRLSSSKQAMLVHPDKNMGNEKAAEAFKKLQNAYEILLDSLKRKAYDDELRREELLNYFRKFQSASHKNGRHGLFASVFPHSEADDEDPHGDSRRIACKKCGNFHVWARSDRSKSRARWCQDCKDFHAAKDGDGWVEQSFQPLLFGLLQKVDTPCAYVCAESRIYDATEWFICQGMRCPANTHKPSFHVNTSITSKYSSSKGTGSAHRGGGIPTANIDESMTEEEFVEWLQNAVQSGLFETMNPSTEGSSNRAGSSSKSSSGKKKKKGKKQW